MVRMVGDTEAVGAELGQGGPAGPTLDLLRQLLDLPAEHTISTLRRRQQVTLYRAGNYAARISTQPEPQLAKRSAHLHELRIPTPTVHHSGPLGHHWATITAWHEPTRTIDWKSTAQHLQTLGEHPAPNPRSLHQTLITPKLNTAAAHLPTAPNALIRVLAERHRIIDRARERYGMSTLHGDLHHGNLLGTPQATYLIDLEHMSYDTRAWDLVPAASRGRRFDGNWQPYRTLVTAWSHDPIHDPEFTQLCLLREAMQTLGSLVRASENPHDEALAQQARRRTQTWRGHHQSWSAW